ncbi:MAG: dockerin type I domain-containing protein, partial [Saprospiraceae bacterium]|nr:dockerin type I domain-containing protein [Saprospiraceae bacterium]
KLDPELIPPPDVQVSCEFWFDAQPGTYAPADDPLSKVFGTVLNANDYDMIDRMDVEIDDPGNHCKSQPYVWGIDGWADDNCDVEITVTVSIDDDCSGDDFPEFGCVNSLYRAVRRITRAWTATDPWGNDVTRVQRIFVVDYDPFYIADKTCLNEDPNDGVIWPCDVESYECMEGDIPSPIIFDDNCSLIGVTYHDTRFDFVDGACYKILREWTIIDWCQYDAENGAGLWNHVQVIKVLDSDPANFTDCPGGPVTLCVEDENVYLPNNNQVFLGEGNPNSSSCSAHVNMSRTVYETCSDFVIYDVKLYPNAGSEYIQVVSKTEVDLDSNNNATLTFSSEFATLPSSHPIRRYGIPYNSPVCSNWPLPGGEKDYHRILWTVEDGCGNISTCEYLFRLEDCKKPSPVCVGLSSVVMPSSGEVTIWAADFNASSFDDCTPAADLLYSFSGTDYQPSMTFDCDAIEANGSPSFIVEIWVADGGNDQDCDGFRQPLGVEWSERNKDYCTTFIVIDDNEGVCGGNGTAGGVIQTEELESVEAVVVNLMDETGTMMQTFTTGDDGTYVFFNPLLSYTIEPHRNDNHKNGVSSLDLVRIQKHLLGLDPFTSPYKLIAADANNSESVSAIDLVEIRKLILGIYTEFPNNESWRFVDGDYVFPDESSPWPFDEVIELEGGLNMDEDFVGIKVGDVNGTVAANAQSIETRNATG